MVVHWGDPLLPGLLLGGLPGAMEGEWVGIRAILERNSQLSYLFNPSLSNLVLMLHIFSNNFFFQKETLACGLLEHG